MSAERPAVAGIAVAVALCAAGACGPRAPAEIRLATTTSVENSGLLDALLPRFRERRGVEVRAVAVGTGMALRLAENGDVDAVLVHDPESEERFVAGGYGVGRREVMRNDFVVAGPAADPAGIRGLANAAEALGRVAASGAPFVSRGDDSGTHRKEKFLWRAAGVMPCGDRYLEAGQGMGAVLLMAAEKGAYCLTDRGTFNAMLGKVRLEILCAGDARLSNPYSVIVVNPARHPRTRYAEATMLAGWLVSPEGQGLIREYRKGGRIIFVPAVDGGGG